MKGGIIKEAEDYMWEVLAPIKLGLWTSKMGWVWMNGQRPGPQPPLGRCMEHVQIGSSHACKCTMDTWDWHEAKLEIRALEFEVHAKQCKYLFYTFQSAVIIYIFKKKGGRRRKIKETQKWSVVHDIIWTVGVHGCPLKLPKFVCPELTHECATTHWYCWPVFGHFSRWCWKWITLIC